MSDPALTKAVEDAVWSNDHASLLSLPQADPTTWPGAVQADVRTYGTDVPLPFPTAPLPACLPVAVVMMVKDEADIIGHNLEWLHFSGVRRMIVLDNGSTDGTDAQMRAFRDRHDDIELVIIDDPRLGYAQSLRTSGMMRLAISLWPDLHWTFPIDADEFLIAPDGFAKLLALPGHTDAVTIPKVVHFCASPVQKDAPGPPMLGMPVRNRIFMRVPNVACGAHITREVTDGNHHCRLTDGRYPTYHPGLSVGLYYREFQIRSGAHFLRKTLNGGPAIIASIASGQFGGGSHWLAYYDILNRLGEEGLFAHFIQENVKRPGPDFVMDLFPGVPGSGIGTAGCAETYRVD